PAAASPVAQNSQPLAARWRVRQGSSREKTHTVARGLRRRASHESTGPAMSARVPSCAWTESKRTIRRVRQYQGPLYMVVMADRPARQRWSTAAAEARDALAYWVDTICKSFLEIDIDSPQRDHFHAQLEETELGPAMLYIVEADTQTVRRTPARIAHSRY